VDEVRISSWTELNEALYEGSWKESLGRFRSNLAFRGDPDVDVDLVTSLMRMGGAYRDVEGALLRNFRKYAQRDAAPGDSIWNWLALAQHHGLPTRLLDWTFSPFVAMHFATDNPRGFDRDGVIWCVDYTATNEHLPNVLKQALRDEGSDVFTAEMLSRVAGSLREFDALMDEAFLVFLEPPSLDQRIINQFALFSLISDVDVRFDQWLERYPHVVKRIIVPAEVKWEVRDKLDQANITERVLFPGLDGLSRWLKRYYSPRER
jgi:hypothetical protein